jgi:uncharacterized protein
MAKFKILSLDGGGIRGAFTAALLAEVETSVGIAGTSTGGIIAMALALGEPADRIRTFYESKGPKIFVRRPLAAMALWSCRPVMNRFLRRFGLDVDCLLQAKYDSAELAKALKEVFEGRTVNDATVARLVIPAVDLSGGNTIVFKTPHLPHAASRDRHYLATDVVLATAAAPTYFPHAAIRPGSAYCDGGLWANNPAMIAYTEATKIQGCCKREGVDPCFELGDIWMLSGTVFDDPSGAKGRVGMVGPRIIDVMSQSQSQGTQWLTNFILGDRHYRVDYDVPDDSWKLDSVDKLEQFTHFGTQAAHTHCGVTPFR